MSAPDEAVDGDPAGEVADAGDKGHQHQRQAWRPCAGSTTPISAGWPGPKTSIWWGDDSTTWPRSGTNPVDVMIDGPRISRPSSKRRPRWCFTWNPSARCSPIQTCSSARRMPGPASRPSPPTATPGTCSASSCGRPAPCALSKRYAGSPSSRPWPGDSGTAGLLNPGYAADLVVFDPDTIDRGEEVGVLDLPGDGFRYIRHSVGVDTAIVNGAVTWSAEAGYSATTPVRL